MHFNPACFKMFLMRLKLAASGSKSAGGPHVVDRLGAFRHIGQRPDGGRQHRVHFVVGITRVIIANSTEMRSPRTDGAPARLVQRES